MQEKMNKLHNLRWYQDPNTGLWVYGLPPIMGAMDTATFDQDSYQGFNDDGDHNTATQIANVNTNWTQLVDSTFHMRFLLQNETSFAEANLRVDLQRQLNPVSSWVNVTGISTVAIATLGSLTDDADTALRIGGGTLVTPNDGADETTGQAGGADLDFPALSGREVELVYSIQIIGADVSDADTIEFRITNKGTMFNTTTNTPSITISKPASGIGIPIAMHHYQQLRGEN